ncbi:MAG: YceD family protein, partial [Blastocatellia bacterium]
MHCLKMVIDLKSIEHETEIDSVIGAEQFDLKPENVRIISNVVVRVFVRKSDHKIQAEGRLKTEAEVDCDRCLEPTKRTLNIEFDLSFVPPEHFP